MFVPLTHDGVKGWTFNLVCPGNVMSVSHKGLLLLESATVNRNLVFGEVCKEKYVNVAYNEMWSQIYVYNGIMVDETIHHQFAVYPWVRLQSMTREWEIQAAFFKSNNITPNWIKAGSIIRGLDQSLLNYTTGQWSGAVGLIQRDEADYAIPTFLGTHPRSKVAALSPGVQYQPDHWLTRYPQELPPIWNLSGLFTKGYISKISKTQPDLI